MREKSGKLKLNGEDWFIVTCFSANDTLLLAESEEDLQRVVTELCSVFKRRKLKGNAEKNNVMMFERREGEVINFKIACSDASSSEM